MAIPSSRRMSTSPESSVLTGKRIFLSVAEDKQVALEEALVESGVNFKPLNLKTRDQAVHYRVLDGEINADAVIEEVSAKVSGLEVVGLE